MTVRPSSLFRPHSRACAERVCTKAPLSLLLVVGVLAAIVTVAAALPQAAAATSIRPYRGLGTWFDMYDYSGSGWTTNPAAKAAKEAAKMKARGVGTLYLETANYHLPAGSETIYRRDAVAALVEQCHARGIKVVAWYLPGFSNMRKDLKRSRAAIKFRTSSGQKFDSFGLDIEATQVKPAKLRTRRTLSLSRKIRAIAGRKYPLGAIIMSPAGMTKYPSVWPDFPYKGLAKWYDVMVPMGYYTYHGDGYVNAYKDTRDNIRIIREKTGRSTIPIHVIGGDAGKSSLAETTAFVRAVREGGIIGASLYDWTTTSTQSWNVLQTIPVNPRQGVASPLELPSTVRLGYCGADRTHPREVFFTTSKQNGDRVLSFRLFDAQEGEVVLHVWNPHRQSEWTATLPATPTGKWGDVVSVTIPASAFLPNGRNTIGFVVAGSSFPHWRRWGVRDVTLSTP